MPKSYISKQKKQLIFSRAKHRCEYCQCRSEVALSSFEIEHILPLILGGDSSIKPSWSCKSSEIDVVGKNSPTS